MNLTDVLPRCLYTWHPPSNKLWPSSTI